MNELKILKGKRLLIVDDEPDVLETLGELLDMCRIDFARYFEDAQELLKKNSYDVAVFDIMGVRGYRLLDIAVHKGIPALMFTAHALSPDDLVKSIDRGAKAYIPKEKMAEIGEYLAELLRDQKKGQPHTRWFEKLGSFFDRQFGSDWTDTRKDFVDKNDWLFPY